MHPGVKLLIVLAREKVTPVFGNEFETVGLEISTGNSVDVLQKNEDYGLRCRLVFVRKKGKSKERRGEEDRKKNVLIKRVHRTTIVRTARCVAWVHFSPANLRHGRGQGQKGDTKKPKSSRKQHWRRVGGY